MGGGGGGLFEKRWCIVEKTPPQLCRCLRGWGKGKEKGKKGRGREEKIEESVIQHYYIEPDNPLLPSPSVSICYRDKRWEEKTVACSRGPVKRVLSLDRRSDVGYVSRQPRVMQDETEINIP